MVLFFTGCPNEFLMDKVRWMAASFVFLGAYFIARGLEWGQLVKKYRTYEALLANDPSGSLSALASATKTSIKEVKQTLNLMIKRGMTGSLTIDEGGGDGSEKRTPANRSFGTERGGRHCRSLFRCSGGFLPELRS